MGGFPVVFVGYELENDALDTYQPRHASRDSIDGMLRDIETETHNPASIVRYDDLDGCTHNAICCFADLRRRPYTSKELDAILVPAEFARVPDLVPTSSYLLRVFAPNAMVFSIRSDGKTRVDVGKVVIGPPSSVLPEILASGDLGDALSGLTEKEETRTSKEAKLKVTKGKKRAIEEVQNVEKEESRPLTPLESTSAKRSSKRSSKKKKT
ncbi:hypothetical protein BDZ97DRAFT_1380718 [Flammula alnicola]|nr:hypothetical protein BDZ97DRAFT_1380718 [Flammula alnicola]